MRKITSEKVQQWKCKKCGNSYTFRKNKRRINFTDVFIKETVIDFVQGRSSFAVIKERKGVSVGTLSAWVNDFGERCMNPVEIAEELGLMKHNKWSGILLLDGKYLNKRIVLLLAVDYLSLDIVSWTVAQTETTENYIKLIDSVESCGYKIKAIVSDGHPGILALTKPKEKIFQIKGTRRYPRPGIKPVEKLKPRLRDIPHQWCLVHAERDINKASLSKLPQIERVFLKILVHKVLFAKTLVQAKKNQERLHRATKIFPALHKKTTLWIEERWEMLTLHFNLRVGRRKIPATSNAAENVISYINQRLKTVRRLRSTKSASNITNLIVANYRTKPLINTKNKLKRGRSPLALTLGKNKKFDWMMFIKKSCP